MAKLITLKVPAEGKKKGEIVELEVRGFVVNLPIGDKAEKFVLQLDDLDEKPNYLTHYASGYRMPVTLNEIKVRQLVRWGTASSPLTDRKAAELLIADIIDRVGADTLRAKLAAAPVLNR